MKAQNDYQRGTALARPGEVYVQKLLPEERQMLQKLHHCPPDATIKTRCQIILLSARPVNLPQIAEATFYSKGTITRFTKHVLALIAAHPEQIEVVTLPTCSPQLNPVERFWKHVRRQVTRTMSFPGYRPASCCRDELSPGVCSLL